MILSGIIKQILNFFKSDKTFAKEYTFTDMDTAIDFWLKLYENKPPWATKNVIPRNMPATIASEFARLVNVEMKSEITGSERAEYLQKQYERLLSVLRKNTEIACACGNLIFKPYISGENILVDSCRADCFIPLKFDDNRLIDVAFIDRIRQGKWVYTRVEWQTFNGKSHTITNTAFRSTDVNSLGSPVPLNAVDEWASITESVTIDNVDKPLFGFFKMPFANQIDLNSPLGVSVYSRAVQDIRDFDTQFSYYLWEFEGGQLALDASESAIRADETNIQYDRVSAADKLPQTRDRLFRKLSFDNDDTYNIFAPTLRDEAYERGLDRLLRQIEANCNLAYGTFSNVQNSDKTAEEVRASKQRSYSVVCDIQASLQKALKDYVYSLDVLATAFNLAPKGKYEVSFEWGDGVLEDSTKEQAVMLQEVSSGLIKKEKYLAYRYGVTEEQAKELLPKEQTFEQSDFNL